MVEQARVNQTVDLTDLRAALLKFADAARDALYLVENDSETFTQWLGSELFSYWRQQVRRCEQHVAQAKVELSRCLASKVFDQTPSCHDQRVALRKAQQRLEFANHKVETVRKWERQLREELIDYRARAQQMNSAVDVDVPRSVAYLDRLINALQAYLAAAPPGIELPPLASLLGNAAGEAPAAVNSEAAPAAAEPEVEPLLDDDVNPSAQPNTGEPIEPRT